MGLTADGLLEKAVVAGRAFDADAVSAVVKFICVRGDGAVNDPNWKKFQLI